MPDTEPHLQAQAPAAHAPSTPTGSSFERVKLDGFRPQAVVDRVGEVFVGKRDLVEKLLTALLANGHVLLEDVPGTGKTLIMKLLSNILGVQYRRIQGTPDLLPGDILGVETWDASQQRFTLTRGPIFTNVLLFDEINRVPPKALSALLEASEERQVTIGGQSLKLPDPFLLLATQNPVEFEGTWVLPEAQLDRFIVKMRTGYVDSQEEENQLLTRRMAWQQDDPTGKVGAMVSGTTIVAAQRHVEATIRVHPVVVNYITSLTRATREHPMVELGASPRGSLSLLKMSRAHAFLQGRAFVVPDDVKRFVHDCLDHRVILKLDHTIEGVKPERIVQEVLEKVPVPRAPRDAKEGAT